MPKDSGVSGGGQDSGTTTTPDSGVTNPNDDAGTMGNLDASNMPGMDAAGGCTCDLNPNACDQGCACDSRCNPTPDGGTGNRDASMPTNFDGGTLTGDPFNPATLATQYAVAVCQHRETCEPVLFPYLGQNRQQCETETAMGIQANFTAVQQLVNAGRVAFSQTEFNRCINSYTTALQDCAVGPDPAACDDIFRGNRPEGIACGASAECADSWCAANLGQCGACTPYGQIGEDCSATVCAPGLDCLQVSQAGDVACVPVNAELNAACGSIQTGLCRGRLQCVGPEMGPFSCARPAAANAACDETGVMPDCNIYQSQVCGPNGTCQMLTFGDANSTCGMTAPTTLCRSTLRCDATSNTCVALPGAGGMCNENVPCTTGNFCMTSGASTQGTCAAEFGAGTACTNSTQCSGTNYCINGACGPLTFQSCN